MNTNPILNVDSYKTSHFLQYPPESEIVSSYVEARGGDYKSSVFFGLQMYLKEYLTSPITQEHIDEAEDVLAAHGVPFNRAGWMHILKQHGGFLPIEIDAVAEGTVLPVSNVLVQARNTDPKVPWLTSYIETSLLRAIWYPTTVATRSRECRDTIERALEDTADSTDGLEFKLHDFGARGASSFETAAIGGAAHLLSFLGTDTLNAVTALRRYYDAEMPGFSIPAAEHSTITAWGKEREVDAYRNMLDQFCGEGNVVAVVSDSYDLFAAIDTLWGEQLRDRVINNGGTVVIRPDSGNPEEIVCESIRRLMDKFGYRENSKGFLVLPDYVRVIQGDGVSPNEIRRILAVMKLHRLSADNIAFGMGGELLQNVNRDTMQFAMKASAICINDVWSDVFKEPVTDRSKRSKRGRLALVEKGDGLQTIRASELAGRDNFLRPVFRNGKLLVNESFDTVRRRSLQIT